MKTAARTDEPPALWTAEDVGRLLRCDPRTVRRKTKSDGLPFIRTGRNRMLFSPGDVNRWLDSRATVLDPEPSSKPAPAVIFPAWDGVRRAGRKRGG